MRESNTAPSLSRALARQAANLRNINGWTLVGLTVAALILSPVIAVVLNTLEPSGGAWDHLAQTVLPGFIANTLALMLGVGLASILLGVSCAWLVTMCRFPGSRILELALLLPLAVPAYVMAYTYADLLQVAGPAQTLLRDIFGWRFGDYWFPSIHSLGGAIVLLALSYYPYVYLLTRAAFLDQSICVLEVGRTLGCGPWASFWRIALPLARPAIAAGCALALMETVAEFGAVQHLGVSTFTTGIYRTWFGMGNKVAAAQLATALMAFVLFVLIVERASRGRAQFFHTSGRYRPLNPVRLQGWRALLAFVTCVVPLALGFAVPVGVLLHMSMTQGDPLFDGRFISFATNSFTLAGSAAVVTVIVALLLSYGQRLAPGALNLAAARLAGMGYAIPGSVIAVGILIPLANFDRAIDAWLLTAFGVSTGLLLSGTVLALIFAYLVRFLAVALNSIDAGLHKVRPTMDQAARALGCTPARTLIRVHAPLMAGSVLTAGLMVFVEVLKELPATLIVRPFNFETLAVRVYQLASDERLAQASTGALTIVAVGLAPVIVLGLMIARARPGRSATSSPTGGELFPSGAVH